MNDFIGLEKDKPNNTLNRCHFSWENGPFLLPLTFWKYVKSTINQVNVECKIFNVRKNITLDGQVPTKS